MKNLPPGVEPDYPPEEEKWNIATHGLGVILAVMGAVSLLLKDNSSDKPTYIAYAIYGFSMVLLYLSSTLYHAATDYVKREQLNLLDHAAIFILIAGTYTPFCLLTLGPKTGYPLLAAVWGVALVGTALKIWVKNRFRLVGVMLYVAMGWMVAFAYEGIFNNLDQTGLWLLISGGIAYMVGAVFYSITKIPFNHAIFHVFVLAGSALHFASIYGFTGY